MNTLAQGAWALLLSRYSGQSEVVFGGIVSGRAVELEGIEQMVGLFVNTLPVHVSIDEGKQVIDWLKDIQAEQAEARQYEYSPLVEVQKWSSMPPGTPLFESVFVFTNITAGTGKSGASSPTDDLQVSLMTQVAGHLEQLVEGMVSDPRQMLARLTLPDTAAQQQMLDDWNDLEDE
jgi:non-ribosomal peptide synthetase component F